MRICLHASIQTLLIGSLLAAPAAQAATVGKNLNYNPATACALSVPTTNTGVRPRATGFRNENGVANFVICGFDIQAVSEGFSSILLVFTSLDNAAHSFSCTAMDRGNTSLTGDYSTKSAAVPASGIGSVIWSPSDFPNLSLVGWNASVTCQLPVGVSIVTVGASHNDEVGQ